MALSDSLKVIYEDNHLIAVNKPNGVLVHEDKYKTTTLEDMVKSYIKVRYKKPGDVYLATLHRIDRPTSGIVIFAKTSKAAVRMSKLFSEKKIGKFYLAITDQIPDPLSGKLVHYLIKNTEKNVVKAYDQEKKGSKRAELQYEMIGEIDNKILIGVDIITGRPHQIRSQFKKLRVPINGDVKYGSDLVFSDQSIALHHRKMTFIHPVKKEPVTIIADLPDNIIWRPFQELINQEGK